MCDIGPHSAAQQSVIEQRDCMQDTHPPAFKDHLLQNNVRCVCAVGYIYSRPLLRAPHCFNRRMTCNLPPFKREWNTQLKRSCKYFSPLEKTLQMGQDKLRVHQLCIAWYEAKKAGFHYHCRLNHPLREIRFSEWLYSRCQPYYGSSPLARSRWRSRCYRGMSPLQLTLE